MRRSVRWLAALGLLVVLATGCGCGDHGASDTEWMAFTGTLTGKSDRTLSFEDPDRGRVDITLVSGRTWPLEVGERYRVRAWLSEAGRIEATMGGRCAEATIRNVDGSTIETSYLSWIDDKVQSFVLWAGGALLAVTLVWGVARLAVRTAEAGR